MSEKILSIIVPSYNMEKYLPKCLGSLVVTPEQMELLEVLVVNDGSKDRTSEIAHEFAAKWPGTFRVIDKENGHYGSCINAALPVATGKYVKVLDADDSFETVAFAEYLRFLDGVKDVDLVVTDYDMVDENGSVIKQHRYEFDPTKDFSIEEFVYAKLYLPMHALTYRTALLHELDYRQREGISYTDTEWAVLPLVGVKRLRYFEKTIYKYLTGREGQTMDAAMQMKNWWMCGEVALDMIEKFEKVKAKASRGVQDLCHARIMASAEIVYRVALCGSSKIKANINLRDFDERLRLASGEWYNEVGESVYSRRFPYLYVSGWRANRVLNPMMISLCKLYSMVVKFVRG